MTDKNLIHLNYDELQCLKSAIHQMPVYEEDHTIHLAFCPAADRLLGRLVLCRKLSEQVRATEGQRYRADLCFSA